MVSPCVAFNNHAGSTKSYAHTRQHMREAGHGEFVPQEAEIEVEYEHGEALSVQLHDGSRIVLRKIAPDFDATDRGATISFLEQHQRNGEIVTGLLHLDSGADDLHQTSTTVDEPLRDLAYQQLCPGSKALDELCQRYR